MCVLRPRCAVLDLSSVLKHMWQTTVGSVYQPLKTQGIADAFFFFLPPDCDPGTHHTSVPSVVKQFLLSVKELIRFLDFAST